MVRRPGGRQRAGRRPRRRVRARGPPAGDLAGRGGRTARHAARRRGPALRGGALRRAPRRRPPVAFPFGHGLGYAAWEYGTVEVAPGDGEAVVRVRVRNTGERAGREV